MRLNTSGMDANYAAAFREVERAVTKLEQSGSATPLAPEMMELPTERTTNPKSALIRFNETDSTLEVYHPGKQKYVKVTMEG